MTNANTTSQKLQHTPGPWTIPSGSGWAHANGRPVATVMDPELWTNDAPPTINPNLLLVAAAPDLLAAAKLALAALNGSPSWTDQTAIAFVRLGSAIAKAEGR